MNATVTDVRAGRVRCARAAQRGFTLIELLTVVAITGILATIAFSSLRGYVSGARGVEALNMVQSIRAAEERWRSEHMSYLDVSTDDLWYPLDPTGAHGMRAFYGGTHTDATAWLQLRPVVPGPVRFGYLVNAGPAGTNMTTPAGGPAVTWPTPPTDNWYVIQAIGDTDEDGVTSYYRASSLDNEVFTVNHGE